MADIKQLKDKNNVVFYPQTHTKAVVDSDGNTVDDLIHSIDIGIDQSDDLMYVYVDGVKQGNGVDLAGILGVMHTITYTLDQYMLCSNNATEIAHGNPYNAVVSSSNADYFVKNITVTMKGTDVSSSVVSGSNINIPRVTGNLSITVTAQFFASVDLKDSYISVRSGGTSTLGIKLHAQPLQSQTVSISGNNLTVSPSSLTFTTENWNTYQYVTVTVGNVEDTDYGYVTITNSDPLLTEITATVQILPLGYSDLVDTTIPTEGMHTVTEEDFTTVSNYGNYVRLTGYKSEYDNIYIPETINGKITWCTCAQGTGAFYNNTTIKYVTFADGVIYRGAGTTSGCDATYLFYNCSSLIGVSNMNPDTTKISCTFRGCSSLKFVDNLDKLINVTTINQAFYNSGLDYVQDLSGMIGLKDLLQAFKLSSSLKKIFGFPKELTTTNINATNAFNGCSYLESAIVPEGVSNLTYTFGGCTSLRNVEIYEDGLTSFDNTFNGCTNLTVYCNANTTTHNTLLSTYGSSSQITIKAFGEDAKPSIVVWGESISSPNKAWVEWPARLQTKLGTSTYLVKNEAIAGEWSTSTTARQGGYVMTTNAFTIPADTTPVLVGITVNGNETFSTSPLFSCAGSYNPCTISNVSGYLSRSEGDYFFTRQEAGDAVSVASGTTIVSNNDRTFNNANNIMLFYLNGNAGWNDSPTKLLDMFQKAVAHFTNLGGTKYIVAGPANLFASQSVSIVQQFEALASEEFGGHWLNLRLYEIQNGLTQNNLTASELDTERMAQGRVPASLVGGGSTSNIAIYGVNSDDQVHPNAYGANTIMLAFYEKGVELGYWQ